MYITSNIGPRAGKHDSKDKGFFVTEHDYRLYFLLLQEDFVKCFFCNTHNSVTSTEKAER
jgi:hypothetical protein